jgi:predicted ribonuclease YlaK
MAKKKGEFARYESINVIMPDVFAKGGPQAIIKLASSEKKNAIFMPSAILKELSDSKNKEHTGYNGALVHISELLSTASGITPILENNGAKIMHTPQVDFILDSSIPSNVSKISTLEYLLGEQNIAKTIRENPKTRFMTLDPTNEIILKGLNLTTEKPRFLITDPRVCQLGFIDTTTDGELYLKLQSGQVDVETASKLLGGTELHPNQFVRFRSPDAKFYYGQITGDFKRHGERTKLENQRLELLGINGQVAYKGKDVKYNIQGRKFHSAFGVSSRDAEQYLALQHALLDPNIEMVFITGQAGSGKTVLAYAAMLAQTAKFTSQFEQAGMTIEEAERGHYRQSVLLKSIKTVDNEEVGFLPGSLYDKLYEHLMPYEQAHELTIANKIMGFSDVFLHQNRTTRFGTKRNGKSEGTFESTNYKFPEEEIVRMTYSGFMRGTSYSKTLLLIDEAQNFSPYVMQMLIQRAAEGSKVIIMGDPYQIDNIDCTPSSNGLVWAVSNFISKPYSALINLPKSHRSQASEDANRFFVSR